MIAGDLEYLMSSLPHLSFQDTEAIRSKVTFILKKYGASPDKAKNLISILEDEAEKFLPSDLNHLFRQINLNTIHDIRFQNSKNIILSSFSKFSATLKQDIKKLRIARRDRPEQSSSKKYSLPLIPGNPLEEEIQLIKLQWEKLEALSIGHYTDFGALVTYKLKLLLLLRWWGFDMEKGFEVFHNNIKKMEHG